MNGDKPKPPERKVGFLDEYQIWCTLVDPYFRELKLRVPNEGTHVRKMIEFFFSGDAREKIILRRKMLREYQFFKSGTGRYQAVFNMEENGSDSEEDDFPILNDSIKTVDINTILPWLRSTDGHMSRLAWFETWAPDSIFYTKIAKPLLSLRSSGSMTVERVAKPL